MTTTLMVGCPISANRDWVMWKWLEYVKAATETLDIQVSYVFAAPVSEEDKLAEFFYEADPAVVGFMDEPERDDRRVWDKARYEHMVTLRNGILELVRIAKPDFFLSLDSDILINPEAIPRMFHIYEMHKDLGCVAVGSKTYMTEAGRAHPSFGEWTGANHQQVRRADYDGIRMADVIMAIKLMSPDAYNVDYEVHSWGEDAGWSDAVGRAGGKLWWDGSVGSKHCMTPESLDRFDTRVNL